MQRFVLAALALAAAGGACAQTAISGPRYGAYPIVIDQPGSYQLTANLDVPTGVKGIVISAPNVTLDLNGHTISGPMSCPDMKPAGAVCSMSYWASATGIYVSSGDATVRNGTVRGFQHAGIYAAAGGNSFADLKLEENAYGLVNYALAKQSFVTRVSAERNMKDGITAEAAAVSSSLARGNGSNGFNVSGASHIIDSIAALNRGIGFWSESTYTLLRGNNAAGNGGGYGGGGQSGGGNLHNGSVF
jgi:hypothetical protein